MKMMKWKLGMILIRNFPYGENAPESTAWTAVWRGFTAAQGLLWDLWEGQRDTIFFH